MENFFFFEKRDNDKRTAPDGDRVKLVPGLVTRVTGLVFGVIYSLLPISALMLEEPSVPWNRNILQGSSCGHKPAKARDIFYGATYLWSVSCSTVVWKQPQRSTSYINTVSLRQHSSSFLSLFKAAIPFHVLSFLVIHNLFYFASLMHKHLSWLKYLFQFINHSGDDIYCTFTVNLRMTFIRSLLIAVNHLASENLI